MMNILVCYFTIWLMYSSRRCSVSTPRLVRISRYIAATSGQSRNSFSTNTLPIKPVAPVTKTTLPANHLATSERCSFASMLTQTQFSHAYIGVIYDWLMMLLLQRLCCLSARMSILSILALAGFTVVRLCLKTYIKQINNINREDIEQQFKANNGNSHSTGSMWCIMPFAACFY